MSYSGPSVVDPTHDVDIDLYLDVVPGQELPETSECPSCKSRAGNHLLLSDGQTWYDPTGPGQPMVLEPGMVIDLTSFCDTCFEAFDFPATGSDADALDSLVEGETLSLEVSES